MTHPLKIFRAEKSLKQRELARMVGVDQVTVSRWETGARPIGFPRWVNKLHEVTGIPRSELRPDLGLK